MQKLKQSFLTIAIGLALAAGLSYAWTGPTAIPPNENAPAPINVSVFGQIKSGPLQVNGFRNIGDSTFDGSVGIGASPIRTAKLYLKSGNNSKDPWALRIEQGIKPLKGKVLTAVDDLGNAEWMPAPVSKTSGLNLTVRENAGTVSCGAKGVTNTISLGRNHFCYIQAVDSNYQGSGDTWRGVYPTDNPDAEGKRNWNVGITCYGDSGNITAVCVNF